MLGKGIITIIVALCHWWSSIYSGLGSGFPGTSSPAVLDRPVVAGHRHCFFLARRAGGRVFYSLSLPVVGDHQPCLVAPCLVAAENHLVCSFYVVVQLPSTRFSPSKGFLVSKAAVHQNWGETDVADGYVSLPGWQCYRSRYYSTAGGGCLQWPALFFPDHYFELVAGLVI